MENDTEKKTELEKPLELLGMAQEIVIMLKRLDYFSKIDVLNIVKTLVANGVTNEQTRNYR